MTNPFDIHYYPLADQEFPLWVLKKANEQFFPQLCDNVIANDQIVYRNISQLVEFKDKNVLIIGGGPSSNSLTPECIATFDKVVSMNHFFMNPLFGRTKIDLVAVGAGVRLWDHWFKKYLVDFKPIIAFELHPNWLQYPIHGFYRLDSTIFFQTHFYGKIGVGVRLVILMSALGVKSVSFIGFDGPEAILKGQHAFEQGKTALPALCNEENAHSVHLDHYNKFWAYITEQYPNTQFISIDKTSEYHKYVS